MSISTTETVAVAAPTSTATALAARTLDIVFAAVLLVLLSPVLLVIAIAIRIDSRGPALFRQTRVGRDLEQFRVCKFRTMHHGSDDREHRRYVHELIAGQGKAHGDSEPVFKLSGDARVTRLGRILRKTSLDELPQLWNVFVGDMSMVGPRPPIPYEVARYPESWFARFAVRPGITGLWQVSGRSRLTLEQMIVLDIQYVRERSLWLNIKIMARTIPVVLSGKGAA